MKRIFALVLSLFILSCTVNESPEYKNIENIKIDNISKSSVVVSAEAVYFNPNHIGGNVSKLDIDLLVNEVKIAKVKSTAFEINSKENFRVPLKADVPYKELFGSSGKQILGNLLNAAMNKKTKINYKGTITIDVKGFEYDYELDEIMELDLKQ